ncbi:tyrosine/nicotianamine aminotransferase, pyridoxal phosphate-dependent transferase [Tanacetum coccineum]
MGQRRIITEKHEWGFKENHEVHAAAAITMTNILETIKGNIDEKETAKQLIQLGYGDPSTHPSFRTSTIVEDALVEAIQSAQFNCYAPSVGINPARRLQKWQESLYIVISDEVYAHQVFGEKPFTPMGAFGDIVPVVTLGSLSKRWIIPGWRFGWIAINDPKGILHKTGVSLFLISIPILIADSIKSCLMIAGEPPTVIQGAVPHILENTPDSFFMNINKLLKEGANMVFERLKEIPFVTCPHKPEGSMFAMVKLNLSTLNDIVDDTDFCMKLAKEESMILLPGKRCCMKRIGADCVFAAEPTYLKSASWRIDESILFENAKS